MFWTSSLLSDAVLALVTIFLIVIGLFKWKYTYWKRVGLNYPQPSIPFGNFVDSAKQIKTFAEITTDIYIEMKSKGAKHAGCYFFHKPIYVPIDPEIIKRVMQNDFDHFTDHGVYFNEKDDPLSAHLFALEGAKWRSHRAKLTPTFTSGKMKMMFPLVVKTSEEIKGVLDVYRPDQPVEMKDILARLTTDIIGTCAFGLDCNSLHDPDSEFRKYGKRVFDVTGMELARAFAGFLFPDTMRYFGTKFVPDSVSKFYLRVVKETINFRESNGVKRDDFMQLLIQMKNDAVDSSVTLEELAAHAFVFYLAGFETSSTTMSLCLLELTQNQEIQQKVRKEINDVLTKHKGDFTYEAMMELHFMDMVIQETLRKYPPLATITRICTKDYTVPDTDVIIEKGVRVFIPVESLQYDPEYFENPQVFDPSRFTDEEKHKRHHFTYLPFGEGPRICIGQRFGMMQTKVGLVILLKHYKFKLNQQTKFPVKMNPKSFVNSVMGGIWMNIEKIPLEQV